ncbi:hypothetical protein JW978_00110 [Candidatus Dojkabacteria bacterium]|nr:hypothetical protein [Candidatus Dojkabacteria bacterium]
MIKIGQNTKQLLFATIITLAITLIVNAKNSGNGNAIYPAILLSSVILVIQVFVIYKRASQKLKQLQIPAVNRYKDSLEIFYHFVLPIVFFIDLCLFIYFNTVYLLTPVLLIFCFIVFLVLFINIRAYFEDKFKIELSTHFIYFFIINFTLFSFCIAILSISYSYSLPIILVCILVAVFSSATLYFSHLESARLDFRLLLLIALFGFVCGIISAILFHEFSSILRTSFIVASLFYFLNSLITHKKEGTLEAAVVFEYLTVLALGFTVLFGINQ